MRIRCDQCGAKYQVSDDKVRHKVFKIRCKRCENVIIVRANEETPKETSRVENVGEGTQTGDNDATRQIQRNESVSSENSAVWHIVVNREQVGPITPQDVAGYLGRGEVSGDAFVWKEGLGDWQKLSGIAEFAHLFDKAQDVPSAGNEQAEMPDKDKGLSFPGTEEPEEDVMMSSGAESHDADPFAQVESAPDDDLGEDPASDKLRGQRNDNSVLFSLDALDAADEAPAVTNTGGTDGSGLIDISFLENFGDDDAAHGFASDEGVSGLGVIGTPAQMPSIVNRRRGNGGLIVAIIFGALIVAGGAVGAIYMMDKKDSKKSNTVANKKTSTSGQGGATGGDNGNPGAGASGTQGTGVSGNQGTGTLSRNGQQNPSTPIANSGQVIAQTMVPGTTPAVGVGSSESAQAEAGNEPSVGRAIPTTNSVPGVGSPAAGDTLALAGGQTVAGSQNSGPRKQANVGTKRRPINQANKTRRKATPKARGTTNRPAQRTAARSRNRRPVRAAPVKKASPTPAAKPKPTPKPKPKPKPSGGDEVDDLLSGLNGGGGGTRSRAKPTRTRQAEPAPSADPLLPEKLGKRDIMSVIKRNSRNVLACRSDDPNLGGVVKVRIVISPSGRVSTAKVITDHAGTSVGRCVSSKVKSFRFPKFRGPSPMSIKVPFRL